MKNKIKIAFGYLAYPFTLANYYRRALERRHDVELFTFGAFTGQHIPWNGGMEIPMKYFNHVDLPLPVGMNNPSTVYAFGQELPWTPDLIINVDAGFHFSDKPKVPYVVVGTDPHVLQSWYDEVRPKADIFYSMQTSYIREGDRFLPYAFDPWCHYPEQPPTILEKYLDGFGGVELIQHKPEREYDCSLIGLHYPHRDEWVSRLRAKGITVNYRIGDIYDEYREENNKAWIGLNWSSLQDVTARVFEICAMKLVPVLNRLPGLDKLGFEEGRHYLGFSTMEEAVEKVLWAKNNRPFAEQIALNAYNFVHEKDYTYDANVRTILKDVGLL